MSAADFYKANGFIIFDETILPADKVADAACGMDQIREGIYDTGEPPEDSQWKPGDDPDRLCKIEQPQKANQAIRELIASSSVGEKVAQVTGAEMVQVWWVQLLYKPSTLQLDSAQTHVGWHQDWHYWSGSWEAGSELLTVWLALSDVGPDSGPMAFVPGSHEWPDVGGGDFFSQDPDSLDFNIPDAAVWQEIPACMPAGGFSIHDKMTIHGSSPNSSGMPRRSLAIHIRTDKSHPVKKGSGFARFLNNPMINPIIFGEKISSAF